MYLVLSRHGHFSDGKILAVSGNPVELQELYGNNYAEQRSYPHALQKST